MNRKRVVHVVGARPNFMKAAPLMRAMDHVPQHFEQLLVHTGQHYDERMSGVFFDELNIPRPDRNLAVGSGSHAWQTAQIMQLFEPVVLEWQPAWVMVYGDVNSTIACALVCSKLGVNVAHIEAGLRSFDRTMPEEVNRVLTDQLADRLFTPSRDAHEHLIREGIAAEKIHFVGNIMIDTLKALLPRIAQRTIVADLSLDVGGYILVTLHRPANVDQPAMLSAILATLARLAETSIVVFPMHPRTRNMVHTHTLDISHPNLRIIEPLGYLDFIALQQSAMLVVTDSGGVQEETTYLGVPCLTMRPNTERPVTITQGTNRLVDHTDVVAVAHETIASYQHGASRQQPEYWDGATAERIVAIMTQV